MRLLACLMLLGACGGAPKKSATRYDVRSVTTLGSSMSYAYDQAADGSWDMIVADDKDPTKINTRIHHVDSDEKPLFSQVDGHNVVGVPLLGKDSEKLTQFYRRNWGYQGQPDPPLFAVSPPLKRGVAFHTRNSSDQYEYTFAIPSGAAEPDLYLPVTDEGQLAWFPDGVIGAKPMFTHGYEKNNFSYWMVRWGKPINAWSVSLRSDLSDLDRTAPPWVSIEEKLLYAQGEYYDIYEGETWLVLGTRADGSCDASVTDQATKYYHVWPRDTHGATCEEARKAMKERVTLMRRDVNEKERIEAEAQEKIRQNLEAEAQAYATEKAAADRAWADEQPLVSRYLQLVKTDIDAACAEIQKASVTTHISMLDFRESNEGGLFRGELRCVRQRFLTVGQQAKISAIEDRRRQREDAAAARAASQHGYEVGPGYDINSSNSGAYDQAHAVENRIKAMEAYSHGGGGICPFERSLCN